MIGIISGYRTGSSTLIKELSETLSMTYEEKWTGELDFHNNQFVYPKPINQIYKIMLTNDNLHEDYKELFYKHWLDHSSNLFYTIRNDITAQIKSWALALASGKYHPILNESPTAKLKINVDHFNNTNDTKFETIEECQSHIDDTFDETTLLKCTSLVISTMQNQYEMYRKYKGTVCWLETRAKTTNKKYPVLFSLPAEFDSWHCGSVGQQYFKE
jgi:hypothetical protein|tara:strand:- start:1259 stop:1903 length:645 start_codon:yes stop_codon:yes gene_type:complete